LVSVFAKQVLNPSLIEGLLNKHGAVAAEAVLACSALRLRVFFID